jgi:hypothetical protein
MGPAAADRNWTPRYEAAPSENRCKSDQQV